MQPVAGAIDPKLLARLAIGIVQGLGLLALKRWNDVPGNEAGPVFFALVYAFAFVPLLLLAGWGALRWRALAIWAGLAVVLVLGLGYYASWSAGAPPRNADPNPSTFVFTGLLLFIAHHLVEIGVKAGRLRGPYPEYFDLTWKRGVQLVLSCLFTGVFWLVWVLGAGLFDLIGISAIRDLITKDWFSFPATTLVFAAAVHLTDARAGLVIGARTLALTLFSWLLPLMAGIVAAFLLTLPIAGLAELWRTRFAAGLLMWAATALIFLLNAAYQAGDKPANPLIALMAKIGCLLLFPLCVLATYGLFLRVGQHGFSASRVIACAGLLMLSAYALGYGIAALSRGAWLARLGAANVWCALLSAGVLLSLLSPLADPSRLAVQSQVARLARSAVSPESFDYQFLASGSGRWGQAALQRLEAASGDARTEQIAALAKAKRAGEPLPLKTASLQERRKQVPDLTGPGAAKIPDGAFLELEGGRDPILSCLRQNGGCSMRQLDLDRDGRPEIVLAKGPYASLELFVLVPGRTPGAPWKVAANGCCLAREYWNKGTFSLVQSRFLSLKAGDNVFSFNSIEPNE